MENSLADADYRCAIPAIRSVIWTPAFAGVHGGR